MKLRYRLASLLMLTLCLTLPARADAPPRTQTEINTLLTFIGHSQCEFYRNGSWHDARAAQAHISDKYAYVSARMQINSAEDFIERTAARSSFSGAAYKVRCPGNVELSSAQWLRNELVRERAM